ncbi:MAG: PD-(D/E)XK nuclease family protein [Bacteroidales bacterium]|nr:PD-(D/E)XK nuclease family protein [Bacteroidales bacterium]
MEPFLRQVARHYYRGSNIGEKCFIFPNRRSMVFFRKYLADLVKDLGNGTPLPVPPMFTINDFFCSLYGGRVSDRLRLLTTLYPIYAAHFGKAEPLDQFIFWGDVLLADFGDVDKYLVDAEALFRNISDLRDIRDDYSYLSDTQREAIRSFLGHFRDGGGDPESVKNRFLGIWNILLPVYREFNSTLREKGMAYEGMVYRGLAEKLKAGTPVRDILDQVFPEVRGYVFVGLNALNECERLLLSRMRDARVAEFVWDYVTPQIQDRANKSSFFMKRNVADYPQAFTITAGGVPEITAVSVPSAVSQTKLAPQILEKTKGNPVETAFVLPDESLLLPLLNSIPPEYNNINVTMGYPLKNSSVYALVDAIGRMQLRLRPREDSWCFYHREVGEVISSSILGIMLSEKEKKVLEKVKRAAKYYIPEKDLRGGPVLEKVFRPVVKEASEEYNPELCRYLSEITGEIGRGLTRRGEMPLELDFAKRLHEVLNVLQDTPLPVLPQTWLKVMQNSAEGISVPFKGEPLKGLQVMGPLETRALDFRNIVILSANEGMFPRRSVSSSFIPPELRKGFGLPTYEFQDAVWAYYFYRLLQRAEKVWLVYDSRTEGLQSGEESRYIKQLEYHYGIPVRRVVAGAAMEPVLPDGEIPKTEEDVEIIRKSDISASSLNCYLKCQAQFYYKTVKKLDTPEEVAESLDGGMIGNVFHRTMKALYDGRDVITADCIKGLRADVGHIKAVVRANILREMRSSEITGRNLVTEQIILDYIDHTLEYDERLLRESKSPGFRIFGLEKDKETTFEGFHIIGTIDRLDSYLPGKIRIVDYKTGRVEDDDIIINDQNAQAVSDKLFGESNSGRPKYALQLFVYGLLAEADSTLKGQTIVNSIYSTGRLFTTPLPDVEQCAEFSRIVKDRLKELLSEITDTSIPFRRTRDINNTCKWCDFRSICGR